MSGVKLLQFVKRGEAMVDEEDDQDVWRRDERLVSSSGLLYDLYLIITCHHLSR